MPGMALHPFLGRAEKQTGTPFQTVDLVPSPDHPEVHAVNGLLRKGGDVGRRVLRHPLGTPGDDVFSESQERRRWPSGTQD